MTQLSDRPDPNDQTVAASEERFRALVTAISDIVYSMSPDWQVMLQLHGRGFLSDLVEPTTDWLPKYVHPDDQEKVRIAIRDAIDGKKIFQLEHRVLQADGTTGWTLSRAVPILDDKGGIREWFGAASDITERKRAEEALREEKERSEQQKRLYETITSGTPDLMYVFDLDYRFTYANQALLSMWGKTWDNAVGKGLLENGYEPWHAEMHEREIDFVRSSKQPIRGEVSFPHATLGRRIYDYIFTPIFNEYGEVEAVAGTTRDISDIRNAETAISESEARFRTMAESTDVMITVGNEAGNAVYFNEAWTILTSRSADELVKNGWLDLVHPQDKDNVERTVATALAERKPSHFEFRLADTNGEYRWLLNRATPRFRSDGSFAGYVSSTIDITELKENEQRKNDFISMVSHELKTPLTSLNAIIQVTDRKLKDNGDAFLSGAMAKAAAQAKRMSHMINGFLNISRLESGKMLITKQLFDMDALLQEMIEELHLTVSSHQLQLSGCGTLQVFADREKIGSVISNLISNAIKYSPKGTTINVSCKKEGNNVIISVQDEGLGLKEQDLEKVFERYFRVETGQTQHIAGFGIGLYLCSEIIKGHGGSIWADSTPGTGSTFHFSLPLV